MSFFFCFILSPAYPKNHRIIRGKVTKVSDGDTVIIRPFSGKLFTCRLYGINAPEMPDSRKPGQPFGLAAEREMNNFVMQSTVDVTITGDRSYDREICIVKKLGMDINREMVRRGYAWAYREHLKSPYASEYIEAEN